MHAYAITDPKYYGTQPDTLKERVGELLASCDVGLITLRDKKSADYRELAAAFMSLKPLFPETLFFLHGDIESAFELGADGVHLPSDISGRVAEAAERGLKVIVSTHSYEEIRDCERAGAFGVTYGPVFETPGKGAPKGLEKLKEITGKISIKLFALGGIVTDEHIRAVESAGADGFASIRYFAEKIHNQGK